MKEFPPTVRVPGLTPPPGGPSTFNGVVYQTLWCLLRVLQLDMEVKARDEHEQPVRIVLVLEPHGGGDVRQLGGARRRVIQLKSRSTGKKWSLRQVVKDVLPDLYKAVDLAVNDISYEFVTETEIGDWESARRLFRRLRDPQYDDDVLASLDDQEPLQLARGWPKMTARDFFKSIVDNIRRSTAVPRSEPVEETYRKLRHLLARFEFTGSRRLETVKAEIVSRLLPRIEYHEDLDRTLNALLGFLVNESRAGNATIRADDLLRRHGLDVLPLTDWEHLRRKGARLLKRALCDWGYVKANDVRLAWASQVASDWPPGRPFLAFLGESGVGKSWRLFALGDAQLESGELVVLVRATGDASRDLEVATKIVWYEIMGRHSPPPVLSRIAEQLRRVGGAPRWLTILLDGVHTTSEVMDLTRTPIEDWGVRLVLSGPSDLGAALRALTTKDRVTVVRVTEFTPAERDDFLSRRLGDQWIRVPSDVRTTLRRPLLADIYCDIADPTDWDPTDEYRLYERYWQRLHEGRVESTAYDATRLGDLAASVLNAASYPWSASQLSDLNIDAARIGRWIQRGWLRRVGDCRFEFPHDRLLNFAVAHGLLDQFHKNNDLAALACRLREMLSPDPSHSARRLGYVPMDVLYLLVADDDGLPHAIYLVAAIESEEFHARETLYAHLLPTLGEKAIPILFARLERVADDWPSYMVGYIIAGITSIDHDDVRERALKLLDSDSPGQRRAALRILSRRPDRRALDRVWHIHRDMQKDPRSYGADSKTRWLLYNESFPALRECACLAPGWLQETIRTAKASEHRIEDLAYVVANLNDGGEVWRHCKRDLIAKVPPDKLRSLATNIDQYRDAEEVYFLLKLISQREDSAGAAAIRALARIDPELAIEQLVKLAEAEMVIARGWFMPLLLELRGDDTRRRLLEHMQTLPDPWPFVLVYQGYENEMDPATVDFLLGVLEGKLRQVRENPPPRNQRPLYPLSMLAEIHVPALLDRFEARRGSALEEELVLFLLQVGPRAGLGPDSLEREPALSIVEKIGGVGFTRVINAYLQGSSRYGRLDAIAASIKAPDDRTRDLLLERALQDELWDGHPVEQSKAAKVLAALGQTEMLVRAVIWLGLAMSPDLDEYVTAARPFDGRAMVPAFAVLGDAGASEDQKAGAVLAVGVGRRTDRLEDLVALASQADPSSPLALACVVTFGLLECTDARVTEFLRMQLEVENHVHAARIALHRIRSVPALNVLLGDAEKQEDIATLALLTQHESTHRRAVEVVRAKLPGLLDGIGSVEAYDALSRLADDSLREVMQEGTIRDGIRAIALGDRYAGRVAGLRPVAIRALALAEPDTAFLACRSALESKNEANREVYARLLVELNEEHAVPYLFEQCSRERSTWMADVIARALTESDVQEQIEATFASTDPRLRRAACLIASKRSPTAELDNRLRVALDDPDRDVADAALQVLRDSRRAREVEQLVQVYEAEADDRRRWILIDALAALGDPGDAGSGWPAWSVRVADVSDTAVRPYLASRINEARKRAKEQANREDPHTAL